MNNLWQSPERVRPYPIADDEVFLGTALTTTDKILVAGNRAHLPAEVCLPVKILAPAQAIQLLPSVDDTMS